MVELLHVSVSAGIGFVLFPCIPREWGWCSAAWVCFVGLAMPRGDQVKRWGAPLEGRISSMAGDKAWDHRAEHWISDPSQSHALPAPADAVGANKPSNNSPHRLHFWDELSVVAVLTFWVTLGYVVLFFLCCFDLHVKTSS